MTGADRQTNQDKEKGKDRWNSRPALSFQATPSVLSPVLASLSPSARPTAQSQSSWPRDLPLSPSKKKKGRVERGETQQGKRHGGGAWFCVRMPSQGPRREWCPRLVHEDRRLIHCKPSTDVLGRGGGGGIRATFTNRSWAHPIDATTRAGGVNFEASWQDPYPTGGGAIPPQHGHGRLGPTP